MTYTPEQVEALAAAMWQLLDDMGPNGRNVCGAVKAEARLAYEPFREDDPDANVSLMPLMDAVRILIECDEMHGKRSRLRDLYPDFR